jgi:LacI family transcriptional regulator
MDNRITIFDVAKKTGCTIATVNRAISNKARISEKTKWYIVDAARAMGYKPSQAAAGISRAQIRIGVLIHRPIHAFSDEIQAGIEIGFKQLADFNVSGEISVSDSVDARDMPHKIWEMIDSCVSGVLIMPPSQDNDFAELVAEIRQKNGITATVVSDLPGAVLSVRNNGMIAGSMAAEMLHMIAPGRPVAVVTANRQKTVHRDAITGFYEVADTAGTDVAGVFEHHDSPQPAYRLMDCILEARPDVGGVYLGSANSVPFCRRAV